VAVEEELLLMASTVRLIAQFDSFVACAKRSPSITPAIVSMSSASISKIFGPINVRIKPDCFIVTTAIIKHPIEAFSSFIWHILILNSRPNSKKVETIRISPILMFMVNESIGEVTTTILSTWSGPFLAAAIENKNIVELEVMVVNIIEIMTKTEAGMMETITTVAFITMKVWTIHHPTCHHLLQ
jgi:hypothetical protein